MPQTKKKVAKEKPAVHYTREQKGHSLILHIFLACVGIGLFTIPYITLSPNHYWHA